MFLYHFLRGGGTYNNVERAYALFTAFGQAFNRKPNGKSWARSAARDLSSAWRRRVALAQSKELIALIERTQIDNRDACSLISAARKNCFIYADPPYVGADQGPYSGYEQTDFEALLRALEKTAAQFMLSSYRNELLDAYTARNGWTQKEHTLPLAASPLHMQGKKPKKIEVLTMNYTLTPAQK